MTDMHIVYGEADCNGRPASRSYAKQVHLNRRVPNCRLFASLNRNLRVYGAIHRNRHNSGRPLKTRILPLEEVLHRVDKAAGISTRIIACDVSSYQLRVWCTFQAGKLHSYHLQRVQSLQPEDYPRRLEFDSWYLDKYNQNSAFPSSILFTNETTFCREEIFNQHNMLEWSDTNPRGWKPTCCPSIFFSKLEIISYQLIGSFLSPSVLDGEIYHIFLQKVLPKLLEKVPTYIWHAMRFQKYGALVHFAKVVRDYLNNMFPQQ